MKVMFCSIRTQSREPDDKLGIYKRGAALSTLEISQIGMF